MSDGKPVDNVRRNLLVASCAAGGVAGIAVAVPMVLSFEPSEKAKAAGAPIEADISGMAIGEMRTFEWRGKPVWIVRRSKEMVDELKKNDPELADPESKRNQSEYTPMPQTRNEYRSLKPEYLVAVGICTHLGCSPNARFAPGPGPGLPDDWPGGFLCPCHGSTFDLAGRVYKNKPAPDNLPVPPYKFLSDSKVVIGEETKA
ncbi:MAG: ubiquinol-cytochrome c reductase iron-sulfur subunit [Burkholderiaceae bacterium]